MKPHKNICPRMMATCAFPRCLLKAFSVLQKRTLAKQKEADLIWNTGDTGARSDVMLQSLKTMF